MRRVRVALHVLDRVVAGDERVNEDRRGDGHQRREKVERADAALDEPRRPPTRAGDRCRDGIGAGDEGGEEDERTECRHDCSWSRLSGLQEATARPLRFPGAPGVLLASYFDGHFAITPFGDDVEAVRAELALEHDLGAVLERVGHDAGVPRRRRPCRCSESETGTRACRAWRRSTCPPRSHAGSSACPARPSGPPSLRRRACSTRCLR